MPRDGADKHHQLDEFEKGTKEKTNTMMRFGGLR
jgi:hypothetical protein